MPTEASPDLPVSSNLSENKTVQTRLGKLKENLADRSDDPSLLKGLEKTSQESRTVKLHHAESVSNRQNKADGETKNLESQREQGEQIQQEAEVIEEKIREETTRKRRLKTELGNIRSQNFSELDVEKNDMQLHGSPLENNVTVEVAKELGFAEINPKIRELAARIFPETTFDLEDLANPETQFKLAMLDSLERQFSKANMLGVRTIRELSLRDQRQLVWNLQKVVPLLNPSLVAGKTFTRNDLDKAIANELAIERAHQEKNRSGAQFRPLRLVDGDGVVLDEKLFLSVKALAMTENSQNNIGF